MGLQATSIVYKHSHYPHYFLCSYLPVSAGRDRLSRSLLDFKQGFQPDLAAWIDCTLDVGSFIPVTKDTIIIRALQHDETTAGDNPPTSLDLLGQALAARFYCHYQPLLLRKSRATPPCKQLSRGRRVAELRQVYSLLPLQEPATPHPSFLLIDDILTTGTTARMILAAIREPYPESPFRVFTLAKAGYQTIPSIALRGRLYQLGSDARWTLAEDEPTPWSVKKLKILIRANSF
jgi:predicted amidophosphoribosyltransferase